MDPARGTDREEAVERLASGVLAGDRATLARAITLVEGARPDQRELAQEVLTRLLPATGKAFRIGITGVPGVGKSTFIDTFGHRLVERGHRVAVLAVDPTSPVSGGSILGDKSRMPRLAVEPRAFIRPSPSALSLGGVARRTREAMLLCEAAGHDLVLVETVGVGQSETAVADMVDFFLVLMLPGAGDELQGIKKGILELADLLAVNKADGETLAAANAAVADYRAALRYQPLRRQGWRRQVVAVSAATGEGIDPLWDLVDEYRRQAAANGELETARREQRRRWLWSQIDDRLASTFRAHPEVRRRLEETEQAVVDGRLPPGRAAEELLTAFLTSHAKA